ncbi:MAG: hypothetical protein FWE16_00500 [Firmicutes bacterium]|nr:hypothetical protein [Bacillota bacterium]
MKESTKDFLISNLIRLFVFIYATAIIIFGILGMYIITIVLLIPVVLFALIALPLIFYFVNKRNKRSVYEKISNKSKHTKYDQILLDIKDKTFDAFIGKFAFKMKPYVSFRNEEPEIIVTGRQGDNDIEIHFEKTQAEIVINEETDKPIMIDVKYKDFESTYEVYTNIVKTIEGNL